MSEIAEDISNAIDKAKTRPYHAALSGVLKKLQDVDAMCQNPTLPSILKAQSALTGARITLMVLARGDVDHEMRATLAEVLGNVEEMGLMLKQFSTTLEVKTP